MIWKISPIYLDFADVPMQEMGVNGMMSNRFLLPRDVEAGYIDWEGG